MRSPYLDTTSIILFEEFYDCSLENDEVSSIIRSGLRYLSLSRVEALFYNDIFLNISVGKSSICMDEGRFYNFTSEMALLMAVGSECT